MGEIRIWLTAKDNQHLTEAEIVARNAEFDRTINAETNAKISDEMDRDEQDAARNYENWWTKNAS